MKTYVIALLLFLPLHLFAGIMQINRCNVGSNSNDAVIIATIDVSIEDLLEDELSVCIDNEIYTLPLLYTEYHMSDGSVKSEKKVNSKSF